MRNIGIELASEGKTICILAGEMDSEDLWEEISESEFKSNVLDGLTVEIVPNIYIYTIKDNASLQVRFLYLDTGKCLCDYITLGDLLNIESGTDIIEVSRESKDVLTLNIVGEAIMLKNVKLISFNKGRSIIQIAM